MHKIQDFNIKNEINCDVAKEALTYISFFDNSLIAKIPNYFLNELMVLAADSKNNYYINVHKKLNEQTMSDNCKFLINLIYHMYIAEDDDKK